MKGDELKPLPPKTASNDAATPNAKDSPTTATTEAGSSQPDLKEAADAKDSPEEAEADPSARRSRAKLIGISLADGGNGENKIEDAEEVPADGVIPSLVALGGTPADRLAAKLKSQACWTPPRSPMPKKKSCAGAAVCGFTAPSGGKSLPYCERWARKTPSWSWPMESPFPGCGFCG